MEGGEYHLLSIGLVGSLDTSPPTQVSDTPRGGAGGPGAVGWEPRLRRGQRMAYYYKVVVKALACHSPDTTPDTTTVGRGRRKAGLCTQPWLLG